MEITHNKKRFDLPKTLILMRHGDKSNKTTATSAGELTELGKKQVRSTALQLIARFGQSAMDKIVITLSPVYRVRQSVGIIEAVIGRDNVRNFQHPILEWGPNDGHKKDEAALEYLSLSSLTDIGIAVGHNGLFENIAQIIHPRPEGWRIDPGQAFIITSAGIEIISPQV